MIAIVRRHERRRKSVTLDNRYDLNNSGTGPTATPGPRGAEMANDYRLNGHRLCRSSVRSMPLDGTPRAHLRRSHRPRVGTEYPMKIRARRSGRMLRSQLENDAALEQEFAAAAAGLAAEYRHRLAGLRGLHRHQRAGAARAIKEWHAAAFSALRCDHNAKRAAARQRRARRSQVFRPSSRPGPRQSYPQRRPW